MKVIRVMRVMSLARIKRKIILSKIPRWSKMTTTVLISMIAEATKIKKRIS